MSYERATRRDGPVSLATKIVQGSGAIPDVIKNFAFNTFLLLYYNQILGLPASLGSLALGIALAIDAITDPMVGSLSDNLRTKLGRRHPLMYASALPVSLFLYLVFAPPETLVGSGGYALFLWLLVCAALTRISITFFVVPWTAMMAELSEDYVERTSIVTYRYVMGIVGSLLVTVGTYTFIFPSTEAYDPGHLNPDSYPLFALCIAVPVFVSILITTHFTQKEVPYLIQPQAKSSFSTVRFLKELVLVLRNDQFLILFSAALTGSVITGSILALDIYLNTFFWELRPEDLRWLQLAVLGALLGIMCVPMIQRRYDKKTILIFGFGFVIVTDIGLINLRFLDVLPENGTTALVVILAASAAIRSFATTVYGVVAASVFADILDYQELRTGKRQEGMFFAAHGFSQKVVSGFGIVVAGLVIDFIELPTGAVPGELPDDLILNMGVIAGIVLPLFYLIPFGLMTQYRLKRPEVERIQKELGKRRVGY